MAANVPHVFGVTSTQDFDGNSNFQSHSFQFVHPKMTNPPRSSGERHSALRESREATCIASSSNRANDCTFLATCLVRRRFHDMRRPSSPDVRVGVRGLPRLSVASNVWISNPSKSGGVNDESRVIMCASIGTVFAGIVMLVEIAHFGARIEQSSGTIHFEHEVDIASANGFSAQLQSALKKGCRE